MWLCLSVTLMKTKEKVETRYWYDENMCSTLAQRELYFCVNRQIGSDVKDYRIPVELYNVTSPTAQ